MYSCIAIAILLVATTAAQGKDYAHVPDLQGVPRAVELMSDVLKDFNNSFSGSDCVTGVTLFVRNASSFKNKRHCNPVSTENVCKVASSAVAATGWWVENFEVRKQRNFGSPKLRKKTFQFAYDFFEKIKNDPEVQNQCCKDAVVNDLSDGKNDKFIQNCRRRFQSSQLYLMYELGVAGETAFFSGEIRSKNNTVYLSESSILNCITEQCIEHLIYHELGHSCQVSQGWLHSNEENNCNNLSDAKSDLNSHFGSGTTQCLLNMVNLEKGKGTKLCESAWLHEAFADLIFMPFWKDPAHWNLSCEGATDFIHGPSRSVVSCGLQLPKIQKVVCSPNR